MAPEGRGYLIWAENYNDVDYVDCAFACARSIRQHTPDANITLITSNAVINDNVFDHVLKFDQPEPKNKFEREIEIVTKTPYKQTIKIEADMIIPYSIDHWWAMLEKRDVVLTIGARDALGKYTTERKYRKIFDENNLPDVYNAITYWRYSELAFSFFHTVAKIFNNWPQYQAQLKFGLDDKGSTDLVYALAAVELGVENVTLPKTSYPTLIHMKGAINNLAGEDWTKEMVYELDGPNIRINTIDQQYPFHYVVKNFSKVLNEHYTR